MANGDLVITTKPVGFHRGGKEYRDYIVGRISGHGGRVMCDVDGGYLGLNEDYYRNIQNAYRTVISALGCGVVETYLPAATKTEALSEAGRLLAGARSDVIGRSLKELPWVKIPDKDAPIIVIGVEHVDPDRAKKESAVQPKPEKKEKVEASVSKPPAAEKVKKKKAAPQYDMYVLDDFF